MLQEKGDRLVNSIIHIVLILAGLICLYPLWYVLICSFSDPSYIGNGNVWFWPVGFTINGYKELYKYTQIWIGYKNTIIYTVCGTLLGMFLQLCCGYALSRRDVPGRRIISTFFVFTMYFSGGMIPTYLLLGSFHWLNTPIVMIVPSAMSVWNMIVARSFFMGSIPDALFDAARIDGCSYIRFFVQVVLPLSGAMIAIIALYNIQARWNSYMEGLMYLQNSDLFTLQQIIQGIMNRGAQVSENLSVESQLLADQMLGRMALLKYTSVIVAAIPMIIAYPFVQKHFVKGVMVGAVKG